MTNYIFVVIASGILCLVAGCSYAVGLYQSKLLNKIRTLEGSREVEPEPIITMGDYAPPKDYPTVSDLPVGLVESKSPQLLEWENRNKIEKEALGQ